MNTLWNEQREFFGQFDHLTALLELYDYSPDVYVWVKNTKGRFIWMNMPIRELCGFHRIEDYWGKTDIDISPTDLAHGYIEEDHKIMQTREPILNRPWIVVNKDGEKNWYISSKIPLMGFDGTVKGTAGIMRDCSKTGESLKPFNEMREAITYIMDHFSEKLSIEELAGTVFLSPRQFERRFSQVFRSSPRQFILKVRLDSAMRMLAETDLSITQIANRSGFYDGSFFTKQFKKTLGITPLEFRKKYTLKRVVQR